MQNRSVVHFIIRTVLVALPPLLLLGAAYVAADPFKLVWHYDRYFPALPSEPALHVHKGMVSVNNLEAYDSAAHFDSFIFGSSISCYYRTADWLRHLPAGASPTHMDSSSEGTLSMRRKVEWLDRNGVPMRNALIVLDPLVMESPRSGSDFLSMDPPAIAGVHTLPLWHATFFHTFTNGSFLWPYLIWKWTGRRIALDGNTIFERQPIAYVPGINEESIPAWDDSIARFPEEFYSLHRLIPPDERTPRCSRGRRIDAAREADLREIASVLRRRGCSTMVVVSPNIHRDSLSAADDALLRDIFGPDRVKNFSGSLSAIALKDSNFYDNVHYRPAVARALMDEAYGALQPSR